MSEMSAAEAATVERFEAGEPAPESWRPVDIVLNAEQFDEFQRRLDEPARVKPQLVELLRRTRGSMEHW